MRDRLIHSLILGDRLAWGGIAVLWVLTMTVVLLHRPGLGGARGAAWTWLLLTVATATALSGLPLSAAISMPRLRWVTVEAPDLAAPSGESWRRLRGPVVPVAGPDLAIPTLDAEGRWILFGLLSGRPVEGLPAAEAAPMMPEAPRLCLPSGEACRPWPVAWPDPARGALLSETSWSRPESDGVGGALAYDVENGVYLRRVEPAPGTRAGSPQIELVGQVAGDVPREGEWAVFRVLEVARGRLKAVRVVAAPAGAGHTFQVQRAEVSLTAGPRAFGWGARPVLVVTSLALPIAVLALLLAPLLHRSRWRRARRDAAPLPYRQAVGSEGPTRREAAEWIAPYLEAAAGLSAGLSAAAPAVVALVSLWGSR